MSLFIKILGLGVASYLGPVYKGFYPAPRGKSGARRQDVECYTYQRCYAAHMGKEIVTIPDEVASNQRAWDREGTAFPAKRGNGSEVMVRLDGEAYGLHTPGTGDPVVIECAE